MPNQIAFRLRAKVKQAEITPATIGLSLFNQFNAEVAEFLMGSQRRVPLDEVRLEILDGSYLLRVTLPFILAAAIQPDLQKLQNQGSLGEIDPKRASVIQRWQKSARDNPDYRVSIEWQATGMAPIQISNKTDYHTPGEDDWVAVEKYVVGMVVDMGGATSANVHLRSDDSGQQLVAASSENFLREQKENYLYRKVQIHVAAQENVKTGELRQVHLLSFVGKAPSYDESELEAAIAKGSTAWANVPDSVAWLEKVRRGEDG